MSEQQVSSRPQELMELVDHLQLCLLAEVDDHVPAEDNVKVGQGRLAGAFQEINVVDFNQVPNLIYESVSGSFFLEVLANVFRLGNPER